MPSRGIGRATLWAKGKKRSFARIIDRDTDSSKAIVQFQNEKSEIVEFELDFDDLVEFFEIEKFMNK